MHRKNRIFIYMMVIALLLLINAFDCKAEYRITTLLASEHVDSSKSYNERHSGLGLQYSTDTFRVGTMRYTNSFDDPTNIFYVGADYAEYKYFNLGANAVYVTGYSKRKLKYPVIAILTATVKTSTDYSLIPDITFSGMPGVVIAFGLSWDL